MKQLSILGLSLLAACGRTAMPDAGTFARCLPRPLGPQVCNPFSSFPRCAPTEAQTRSALCDLATYRPEAVSAWTCLEGIQWRVSVHEAETCSFVDEELAGATIALQPNPSIGGEWQMHDCVQTDLCLGRDAGSCLPIVTALQNCDEDRSHFDFCAVSERRQRTRLCSDAGSYGRHAAICDGGVRLTEVVSGFGPTRTCFYSDGGFVGGSEFNDTGMGALHGVSQLADCQPASLCP